MPLRLLGSIISASSLLFNHPSTSVNEAAMHYSAITFDLLLTKLIDINYIKDDGDGDVSPNKTIYYEKNKESIMELFDLISVLRSISVGSNGKSAQGKTDARHCCVVLKKILGDDEYGFSVNDIEDISQLKVCRESSDIDCCNSYVMVKKMMMKMNKNKNVMTLKKKMMMNMKKIMVKIKMRMKVMGMSLVKTMMSISKLNALIGVTCLQQQTSII